MSEDIFSQFFNLFNNEESGVNWELAKQINNHITKDEEVLPLELSNNEINFEQIFRVIELKSEEFSSYESSPNEIRLMSPKEYGLWFIESIKHFDFDSIDSKSKCVIDSMNHSPYSLGDLNLISLGEDS